MLVRASLWPCSRRCKVVSLFLPVPHSEITPCGEPNVHYLFLWQIRTEIWSIKLIMWNFYILFTGYWNYRQTVMSKNSKWKSKKIEYSSSKETFTILSNINTIFTTSKVKYYTWRVLLYGAKRTTLRNRDWGGGKEDWRQWKLLQFQRPLMMKL